MSTAILTVGHNTFRINQILFQGMTEAALTALLDHIRVGDIMPDRCPYSDVDFTDDNPACIMIDADGAIKFGTEAPMELRALDLERPYMLLSAAVGAMEDERRTLELARETEEQRVFVVVDLTLDGLKTIWAVDGKTPTEDEVMASVNRVLKFRDVPENAYAIYLETLAKKKQAEADEDTRQLQVYEAVAAKIAGMPEGANREELVTADPALGAEAWRIYTRLYTPPTTDASKADAPEQAADAAPLKAQDEGAADPAPQPDADPTGEGDAETELEAPGEKDDEPAADPAPQPDAPQDQEARDAGAAEVPGAVIQTANDTQKAPEQPNA